MATARRRIEGRTKRLAEWEVLAMTPAVKEALKILPSNYEFELPKTLWKIISVQAKTVVLQFPEGLLMFACMIADIVHRFTGAEVAILAEVTYGACCIDDYAALKLNADLLVHYGHSCLVPVQDTKVKTMYVFVGIQFNTEHLIATIKKNFSPDKKVALLGTVQFLSALSEVQQACDGYFQSLVVPQVKPLSRGETLGCTAPFLPSESDLFVFVADGRFHMEAVMIRNPTVPAYRYDPYNKVMSLEKYDQLRMLQIRKQAVESARSARIYGVILGTLGHQGNPRILQRLKALLTTRGKKFVVFLMAEIHLPVLARIAHVDAWIQISCPRLSVDWGAEFPKPLLNVYEAMVALEHTAWQEGSYPMDYYSNEKAVWSNYH